MSIKVTNGLDLNKTSLIQARIHPVTSTPGSPVEGQIWYRSDLDAFYFWNGSSAQAVASSLTGAEILALLLPEDGAGSGLDADLLDGVQGSAYATVTYVDSEISTLVGGASAAYDTLGELATALTDNDSDIASILTAQAGKTDKYAADVGNNSDTAIVVNHALGTSDVIVQVREVSTLDVVLCDIDITDANNVTLTFETAPTTNQFRVVVIG